MARRVADGRRVLQRVIFPESPEPGTLPLYLDPDDWASVPVESNLADRLAMRRGLAGHARRSVPVRLSSVRSESWLRGRRGLEVPASATCSLGSYFNAFPASYWSAWTTLTGVVLRVRTEGAGRLAVHRSNARGIPQLVTSREVLGETTSEFEVPFTSFLDGGWIWFDLIAGATPLRLIQADWLAPHGSVASRDGEATVAITTLDRGDDCTALLAAIGLDPDALDVIDHVVVVDQGASPLRRHPSFVAAEESLGGRLEVIEQANLGGSGGFSRGMLIAAQDAPTDYVLLLDDDAAIDPEAIRRAVCFADFCARPTIVGGHMFDMYDRAKLHAFAEGVRSADFMWGPTTPTRHDLGEANLRQTPWLHRRYDVDYNGWWMSLIPTDVVRRIGASLPVFIKWDDAEYSLRARDVGVPTVSLPGAAVWHVSWVDKDDTRDWQAFFHARNRLIAALLHSAEPRGGKLARANFAEDLKHLLMLDYATVTLRHEAIRDVLQGPERLHAELATRLERVRTTRARFRESRVIPAADVVARFATHPSDAETVDRVDPGPSGPALVAWLVRQGVRHAFTSPAEGSGEGPTHHLAFQDARWFRVPEFDSVLVSNAAGSGSTWHVRDPRAFRRLLRDSVRLNLAYRRRWDRLQRRYRAALPELTSLERWERTFAESSR
jgi:galactofuranosylgalactofuranosylrhamnosyl-N-acetylglucosaminyl-diphospho-decaprenol beta-1,5/1,6-galactofuranosyltransferase